MRHEVEFLKYQGCGNDFILKDELSGPVTSDRDRSEMAKRLWNRHFWVGADGILFVESAPEVDGSMRLFEPAGNEADMCGNGLRCVAAFLMEKLGKDEVDVLTRDGVKKVVLSGDWLRVDMGPVRTHRRDLSQYIKEQGSEDDSMLDTTLDVGDETVRASLLNTGEPHFVVFTEALDEVDLVKIGEHVNSQKDRFPSGVNVNYVQVTDDRSIRIRTYERGVFNETNACGTGATASAAASVLLDRVSGSSVNVRTRGGPMVIDLKPDGTAEMTGPAVKVFQGRLTIDL